MVRILEKTTLGTLELVTVMCKPTQTLTEQGAYPRVAVGWENSTAGGTNAPLPSTS